MAALGQSSGRRLDAKSQMTQMENLGRFRHRTSQVSDLSCAGIPTQLCVAID